ncbi:YtpR family tRNA-binding protein [Listeria sp. PSOL-1]|uniref:YtpR family tRNA-binding protein n=1 Tax=Listeria sp. PSOL-1 TaxID=1844999 RepID=UPI0013D6133C|nr:DUF4479 family protein [Listeria sp. PSOL-1]
MIVNLFYNKEGIGDTLIVAISDVEREKRTFIKKGDVAKIMNQENGELSGFNIFNCSKYLQITETGKVTLDEELLLKINQVIHHSGFDDTLVADLTPKFVVGYVTKKEKHPNADKLSICLVDIKDEQLQIVCGAPNVATGQKVVVAKVGAVMPSGLIIKPSNLRGIESFGMLCAARELAIPLAPEEKGILVLSDEYEIGDIFPVTGTDTK